MIGVGARAQQLMDTLLDSLSASISRIWPSARAVSLAVSGTRLPPCCSRCSPRWRIPSR
jgi:hypothetical protein